MRDVFICMTTFFTTLLMSSLDSTAGTESLTRADLKHVLIECKSLAEHGYLVKSPETEHRAAAACSFGGYYPLEPSSKF